MVSTFSGSGFHFSGFVPRQRSRGVPVEGVFHRLLQLPGAKAVAARRLTEGEQGNPVVHASTVTRTEMDEETGEEQERDIPFLKGDTVFNVELIKGLPAHFHARAEPRLDPVQRIDQAEAFFAATGAEFGTVAPRPTTPCTQTICGTYVIPVLDGPEGPGRLSHRKCGQNAGNRQHAAGFRRLAGVEYGYTRPRPARAPHHRNYISPQSSGLAGGGPRGSAARAGRRGAVQPRGLGPADTGSHFSLGAECGP